MDDLDRLEAHLLDDERVRAALDARSPAFDLARQMIGIRVAAGLTQQQLAARAGMTQPEIARLESGAVTPTWETLSRIFAAVGARVEVKLNDTRGKPVALTLSAVAGHRARRPRPRLTNP